MLCHRVVPCLDVANGRVVKGTNFVDLVDEGDPPELAERYAREGADELVFLDITAAPEGRGTLLDIVERTARRAFIPLTVGGGVRHVNEMRDVLRAGADKVSLNTAAVADPDLVKRCARRFGRQAVVVAIDARRLTKEADAAEVRARPARTGFAAANANRVRDRAAGGVYNDDAQSGTWEVFVRGGRVATGMNAVGWAERAAALGAGELLVTSIDRDGTRSGYDTELLRAISDRVSVPVVASGGAAGPADFVAAVRDGHADAVLAASIFHRRMHSIADVKAAMAAAGISVRIDGRTAR
jgi:imidazole glycerol-phosphate synthase subunit HisF